MMPSIQLHYIYDPLCGWTYAAGPMVAAVSQAGIPIVLHGGGLWDPPKRVEPSKRSYIQKADARIAELTGVSFGTDYLEGLLKDPATVFWSRPTIAAVLAAEKIRSGQGLHMLRAIQHAHYVEGRRVVENAVLVAVSGSVGLEENEFRRALEHAAADDHIVATRRLMRERGMTGFPGFLVEHGGNLTHVEHETFYDRPRAFVDEIKSLNPIST